MPGPSNEESPSSRLRQRNLAYMCAYYYRRKKVRTRHVWDAHFSCSQRWRSSVEKVSRGKRLRGATAFDNGVLTWATISNLEGLGRRRLHSSARLTAIAAIRYS
ncbi:hypothetical protein B0J13DRAFT_533850 [Dactylonectria estremocensis]|uniref:Uncharacterized protein n=1 Tax=Dactylonectria estremocensis TaxID=1079267 RepID=A0A9P9D663_9HYPO|nr:hypothetical protein B0J13DRAFT_533850 [Dactylonectria estremocensis]